MFRFSIVAILSLIAAATMAVSVQPGSAQQDSIPQTQEPEIIISDQDSAESISRRDFMRTKLLFSQQIFEGLTTADFAGIERAVKEVQAITEGEKWVAIDNDHYRKLTEEFKTSTARLLEAAKTKNLDATALRYYNNMSTSCIDCHKHIRKAGYEF